MAAAHPRKTGPLGPRTCREIADAGKAVLFDRAVQLGTNGNALDTNKEQFHMHAGGSCPKGGEISSHAKAYLTYTLPKLTVRKRWAMGSLTRQTITLRRNVILSNSIVRAMDAMEDAFVWNYTMRECEEKELEEIYSGQLGVIFSGKNRMLGSTVLSNDPRRGQRAWLQIGCGTIICGRIMRETHLPHVYVEWDNPEKDARKR